MLSEVELRMVHDNPRVGLRSWKEERDGMVWSVVKVKREIPVGIFFVKGNIRVQLTPMRHPNWNVSGIVGNGTMRAFALDLEATNIPHKDPPITDSEAEMIRRNYGKFTLLEDRESRRWEVNLEVHWRKVLSFIGSNGFSRNTLRGYGLDPEPIILGFPTDRVRSLPQRTYAIEYQGPLRIGALYVDSPSN